MPFALRRTTDQTRGQLGLDRPGAQSWVDQEIVRGGTGDTFPSNKSHITITRVSPFSVSRPIRRTSHLDPPRSLRAATPVAHDLSHLKILSFTTEISHHHCL